MIYLDNNATTQLFPEVFEAMKPFYIENWGNPSSSYKFGASLKSNIQQARSQVAELINARASEVFFTSCATESNNTAIHAAIKSNPSKKHIITSLVEHSSVINYCKSLEKKGYKITYLPVSREGLLNITDLENAIKNETVLISIMWANNETGVLFPVKKIAEICKSRGILYHCDAVQAAGKIQIDIQDIQTDFLSLSAHKFHGPKGAGALYVRKKTPYTPYILGGHQERNMRAGTENVPNIVGMGKAAEIACKSLPQYDIRVRTLRDTLENSILTAIPNSELNGHKIDRLVNTSNITFHGIESEALLILLDQEGICASSGSACLADSDEPSHVITAMKPEIGNTRQTVRFSLNMFNTKEEIERTLKSIHDTILILKNF